METRTFDAASECAPNGRRVSFPGVPVKPVMESSAAAPAAVSLPDAKTAQATDLSAATSPQAVLQYPRVVDASRLTSFEAEFWQAYTTGDAATVDRLVESNTDPAVWNFFYVGNTKGGINGHPPCFDEPEFVCKK